MSRRGVEGGAGVVRVIRRLWARLRAWHNREPVRLDDEDRPSGKPFPPA